MKLLSQLVMIMIYTMGNSCAAAVSQISCYLTGCTKSIVLLLRDVGVAVKVAGGGSRSKDLRLKVIRNVSHKVTV